MVAYSEPLDAVVLAPVGRDAALASAMLGESGLPAHACPSFGALCAEVRDGIGVALIAEEQLTADRVQALASELGHQPLWSDLPIIVLSSRHIVSFMRLPGRLQELGNVSFIDRPVQRRTLLAAVRAALRARQKQYDNRRAIGARDQFLAMLGHELRNPLAAILFANELVGRSYAGDALLAKYTEGVDRQTRHLNHLLDDLLDVARVTSGKFVLKREPTDLVSIIRSCIESHELPARNAGVNLKLATTDAPIWVLSDVVRLEQVVTNLLTNALKFTPKGGDVRVSVREEDGDAKLSVLDTGAGIPPAHLEAIFDVFAQGPTSLDRSKGGLGLGLTLVRRLIEMQGGRVFALSDGPGLGSELCVHLPVIAAPDLNGHSTRVEPAPAPAEGLRVLIIEDNRDIRELLYELLTSLGYHVATACDGPDGLALIASGRPEAVLIDIGLPGLDGYEIARRVRRDHPDPITLVAMTGYGQPEDRAQALAAGFDSHVTKPVGVAALLAVLRRPAKATHAG